MIFSIQTIKFQTGKNSCYEIIDFDFSGNQRVLLVSKKHLDSHAKDEAIVPEQNTEPLAEFNENSPACTGDSLIISSDPPSPGSTTLTADGMYYTNFP